MAGLPAQHYAHFFIYMASPKARQLLTDNETMYKWEDEPGQDTEMLEIRIQLTVERYPKDCQLDYIWSTTLRWTVMP